MRNGDRLCLDIDKTKPEFNGNLNLEGTFHGEQFFNYQHMTVEANFMPYVREDENHGIGGTNPGFGYCRAPNFLMTLRSGADNDDELAGQVANIPNFATDFMPFIVEWEPDSQPSKVDGKDGKTRE